MKRKIYQQLQIADNESSQHFSYYDEIQIAILNK